MVKAELQELEALLTATYVKLSWGMTAGPREAGEVRRLRVFGRRFSENPEVFERLAEQSDEQIIQALQLTPPKRESLAWTAEIPQVRREIASVASALPEKAIEALGAVRLQAQLMEQDAEWMGEWLRMSFTVTDPGENRKVKDNHKMARESYRLRVANLLDATRRTLSEIEK